nr:hypothetical protein RVX_1960 [Nitratidesulfovibrio sp. HK-II]
MRALARPSGKRGGRPRSSPRRWRVGRARGGNHPWRIVSCCA